MDTPSSQVLLQIVDAGAATFVSAAANRIGTPQSEVADRQLCYGVGIANAHSLKQRIS